MTSMPQLLLGLQRLSVSVCKSSSWTSLSRYNLMFLEAQNAQTLNRCCFHNTPNCDRKLDNRAHPPYKYPSSKKGRWEPLKKFKDVYEYTTEPLPFPKTGGRGPNGRIWNHRRGGGRPWPFRMVDWIRGGPSEGEPLVEKVEMIQEDPNRSANLALVASGEHKRFIIATQNMKPGDLIKSSTMLTKTAVRANEGDAYPVGSLPIGTLVNSVQRFVGKDARFATSAGCQAQIVRKMGDMVVVRMPSKREMAISVQCQATVGRVCNIEHNQRVIGKAGTNRLLGIRPSSGRWHRKTGRFGRKIRPLPPVQVFNELPKEKPRMIPFTF